MQISMLCVRANPVLVLVFLCPKITSTSGAAYGMYKRYPSSSLSLFLLSNARRTIMNSGGFANSDGGGFGLGVGFALSPELAQKVDGDHRGGGNVIANITTFLSVFRGGKCS